MIFLVKDNGKIRIFHSEDSMKAGGFNKADLTVTEEKFNSNGCYARLIDGKIVVGKTEAEIADAERMEKVTDLKRQLDRIDRKAGASRIMRETSIATANICVLLGVTDKQITAETDPAKKKALQLLRTLDPSTNSGFATLVELEKQAGPIRDQMRPLLTPQQE